MQFMMSPTPILLAAALLFGAAAPASAQEHQPIFRCQGPQGPTYSHAPCGGGVALNDGSRASSVDSRHATVSQDRARLQNRSVLTAEVQQECSLLEARMRREESVLRGIASPTPADEKVWLQSKLRFRELKC
jgi:hypothetical protein